MSCTFLKIFFISAFFFLSPQNFSQWSTDPNNNLIVGYGLNPELCSDSAGGCYVTYEFETTGYPRKLAVERLDKYGYKPWGDKKQILGELEQQWMAEIVEDGEGGVIISYLDETYIYPYDLTYRVRVQRVDSAGNLLWGQTGVRVTTTETNHGDQKLISDGNGGCIIAWEDTLNEYRINRISNLGQRLWGDSGKVIESNSNGYPLLLCKLSKNNFAFNYGRILYGINVQGDFKYRDSLQYRLVDITSDNYGGVVASWLGGSISNIQIVSQRKDSLGNNLWQEPYIVVTDSLDYNNTFFRVKDNNGYFYYSWSGKKHGVDKVAQFQALRLDGTRLLSDGSIQIGNPPLGGSNVLPLEINKTAFIYHETNYLPDSLLAQTYDTLGNKLWNTNGVLISHPSIEYQSFTTDGNNGFIIGGVINNFTVVAQQVSRSGNLGEVIPVPVELISFTGVTDKDKIILSWITATELNNYGFEIERIQNSKIERFQDWMKIGFVHGEGTTTEPKSYSFVDENITTGTYKYRLKQIDFDGSFEYSTIVEVDVGIPTEYLLEQNYPNPFNSLTIIKYQVQEEGRLKINLYNVLGERIKTLFEGERSTGTYKINFSSDKLPSGNYFYSLESNSDREVKKLTIIK